LILDLVAQAPELAELILTAYECWFSIILNSWFCHINQN
jgi:hypothetical protein